MELPSHGWGSWVRLSRAIKANLQNAGHWFGHEDHKDFDESNFSEVHQRMRFGILSLGKRWSPTSQHEQQGFQKVGQQVEAEDAGGGIKEPPLRATLVHLTFVSISSDCCISGPAMAKDLELYSFAWIILLLIRWALSYEKIFLGWIAFWDFILCFLAGVLLWLTPGFFPLFK